MSDLEQQEEEREVLASIYDGDTHYKQLSPTKYQYKYGEDENVKSFLLEISWGPTYPTEPPTINMDTFYNRNIIPSIKQNILSIVSEEAQQWLGCGMTYTLFECLKERVTELLADQPETPISEVITSVENLQVTNTQEEKKVVVKKPQLSKSQKRRQWERVDGKGEHPRGWDWVDIVKHLSQTGYKEENASTS